eukprot:Selendium_serpulae@DN6054_c0_g1_i14.p2
MNSRFYCALIALGQLPLGLLRKKFSHKRDAKLQHIGVVVTSLVSEALAAAVSPLAAVSGFLLHIVGSRVCVYGITGGVGAGKSTLARYLKENHFHVIDADVVSRQIMEPGQPAYNAVVRLFGASVIQADGQINRRQLRELVFQSEKNRKRINQITHFHIFRVILWQVVYHRLVAWHPHVAIDAPLLCESKILPWICSPIIVVDVKEDIQMERLQNRDGHRVSAETLQRMARSHMSSNEKCQRADKVLDNNSGHGWLCQQAASYFRDEHNVHMVGST